MDRDKSRSCRKVSLWEEGLEKVETANKLVASALENIKKGEMHDYAMEQIDVAIIRLNEARKDFAVHYATINTSKG